MGEVWEEQQLIFFKESTKKCKNFRLASQFLYYENKTNNNSRVNDRLTC